MSTPRRQNYAQVAKDYVNRLTADDSSTEPQLMTVIPVSIPDAATGDVDVVMATKFEVVDVVCQKRNGAGAGNTVTVKSGANAISDAIACATDNAITRSGTIDDANSTIIQGGTLRLSCTRAAGTRNSLVLVYGFIRA
jgi:hypothetical protein